MENNQDVGTVPTEKTGVEETPAVQKEEATKSSVQAEPTAKETKPAKTYTQEEVDAIIQERLARENKKNINVELEKQVKELKEKLATQERNVELAKYKLKDGFKEFVEFKVSKMVGENKDFATALEEYLKGDGANFVEESKIQTPPPPRPENIQNQNSDYAYLKSKYPNIKI